MSHYSVLTGTCFELSWWYTDMGHCHFCIGSISVVAGVLEAGHVGAVNKRINVIDMDVVYLLPRELW